MFPSKNDQSYEYFQCPFALAFDAVRVIPNLRRIQQRLFTYDSLLFHRRDSLQCHSWESLPIIHVNGILEYTLFSRHIPRNDTSTSLRFSRIKVGCSKMDTHRFRPSWLHRTPIVDKPPSRSLLDLHIGLVYMAGASIRLDANCSPS